MDAGTLNPSLCGDDMLVTNKDNQKKASSKFFFFFFSLGRSKNIRAPSNERQTSKFFH